LSVAEQRAPGRASGDQGRFVDLAGGVEDGVVDSHVSASVG